MDESMSLEPLWTVVGRCDQASPSAGKGDRRSDASRRRGVRRLSPGYFAGNGELSIRPGFECPPFIGLPDGRLATLVSVGVRIWSS